MDYQKCVVGSCGSRVPMSRAPVCSLHAGSVEPGVCVDAGDQVTTARRFIPISDPEASEAANEPLLRPRRAIRWTSRVYEFGAPMS